MSEELYGKLDELISMLKGMKETDKHVISRIENLETRLKALETLVLAKRTEAGAHLSAAGQYAKTNYARAIEELIKAVSSLQ